MRPRPHTGSVAQLCPTRRDPMDCSLLGSSISGIFQARLLEWVAISFSRDLPYPGIKPTSLEAPALVSRFFYHWAIWEAMYFLFSSVQFSRSVVSNSLRPHELHPVSLSITNSWSLLKLVHRVGDAIQPSHLLSSPSPPAPNPSQHQGLFQWVNFSHEVAKVLAFQLQHQSFQWTPRTDLL